MSDAQFLRDAKRLIDTPEKWHQGDCAVDAAGQPVNTKDPAACKFCVFGALLRQTDESMPPQAKYIQQAFLSLKLKSPEAKSYIDYNDMIGRKHADIMKLFDRAIEIAEQESKVKK